MRHFECKHMYGSVVCSHGQRQWRIPSMYVIKNISNKSAIDRRLCDVYEYLKTSPIFIDSEKYMLSQDKMAIVGISKNYSSLLILGAF